MHQARRQSACRLTSPNTTPGLAAPPPLRSVLKGDKVITAAAAGRHLLQADEVAINYGWAPFNGPSGQVRAAPGL